MPNTPSPATIDAVLGLISAAKLAQFSALARVAIMAPDVASRVAMARRAAVQSERVSLLGELMAERSQDQMEAISRFIAPLDAMDRALQPADWWEALVMGYVSQGVASDLEAALIDGLGPEWIDILAPIRSTGASRERVERIVAATATSDERWASRLSLWGRRVVGEALSTVQHLVASEPDLAPLLAPLGAEDPTRLRRVLTAAHATRMARLGLTA